MKLALNVTFVGLVVVFLALILLAFIISLFSKAFSSGKKANVKHTKNTHDEASILEIEEEENQPANSDIYSDNELAAVLAAAVLASLGSNVESNIRVKSFRRIPQTSPLWNSVSRKDQIASKL